MLYNAMQLDRAAALMKGLQVTEEWEHFLGELDEFQQHLQAQETEAVGTYMQFGTTLYC